MALSLKDEMSVPNYTALSTDIVGGKIDGATLIGGTVLVTDTDIWYIIRPDLTLATYSLPVSIAGDITIGAVNQGDAGIEAWKVDGSGVTQPVSGDFLTDAQLRATAIPVTTDGLTDTELRATPVPVSATTLPLPTGASTETTLASTLTQLQSLLTELQLKADLTETQPTSNAILDGLVEARTQTPTIANAINVQIGPGDPISNVPVVMDFGQHQVHEGEAFLSQYVAVGLATSVVKFQLIVGSYADSVAAPHLQISLDVYDGAARIDLYEGGTAISGGTPMVRHNRHRSIAVPATAMTINSGVTATGTLLLESAFAGGGLRGSAGGSSNDEWILKANTTYIAYLTGQTASTDAILHFEWYEDAGV